MTLSFKKAKKSAAKLRLELAGPSGSGKTYTALSVGSHLGKRMAVIDTERDSAQLYADRFEFEHLNLPNFEPETYMAALEEAAKQGFDVVVIDSLSHAWEALKDRVDSIAKVKYRGNTWSAWSEGTPVQNALVGAILNYPGHILCCVRSKTEWSTEKDDRGKTKPVKVGLAPVQRDNLEYEFTICLDMTDGGIAKVGKTRWSEIAGRVIEHPGQKFAEGLLNWLNSGEPAGPPASRPTARAEAHNENPSGNVERAPAGDPPIPPDFSRPRQGPLPSTLTAIDVLRDEAESVPLDVESMDMTIRAGELAKSLVGAKAARDTWRDAGKLDGVAASGKQLREFLDLLLKRVPK